VPSNWELQGFGTYNYGHDKDKGSEQGRYRRTFTVPQGWSEKRVFIVFDGVMTDTEVFVNGKSAGLKHQGGFYRFTYEITDLIKPGENLLDVTVSKVSSDASVEAAERQADYWVFGGIYRPVRLEAVPKQFIEWVAIDAQQTGAFRMDVHVNGIDQGDIIAARITGPVNLPPKMTSDRLIEWSSIEDANRIGAVEMEFPGNFAFGRKNAEDDARDEPLAAKPFEAAVEGGQTKVWLETLVTGHKNWSAEKPYLYVAKVELRRGDRVVHAVTQRFGFRSFEVRPGSRLYLNGQRVILKGVCRHSFWPDSGRCLSPEISVADVKLIKEMNMNAMRMSHYPPDEHFLDACDELGLYVLDVWGNRYKNDVPGVTWDFPEFKGYYKDWRWVVFTTEDGTITMVSETPELFLGVYRPNDGSAPVNTKLNVPDTGIALLHGIPTIGTKFNKAEALGPMSRKNQASGVYRGAVWFHFDTESEK
jgi:hypothetical protein